MSFICHIHNYTEYNEEWNVFSAFNPSKCTHLEQWAADCAAPGEQSWTSCRSRDSNPQPWVTSGFKSNALSIRPTTACLLIDGVVWITCGYVLISCLDSFWRHPFTADDPLVGKSCKAKFLQMFSNEETNSSICWMAWGWLIYQMFIFWWTI